MKTKKKLFAGSGKSQGILGAAIAFVGFFVLWQLAVSVTPLGRMIPSPVSVFQYFFDACVHPVGKLYTLPMHALISFRRIVIGYLAAVILGVVCGIGMGMSKTFSAIFKPIFELIRPIPTLAWIPLALVWFGSGEMSKYFIVFYGAFANIVINTFAGVSSADPVLKGAARMLGAKENQMLTTVILPWSVPYIFSGMQIALSASLMGVIASEMVKANEGIGWVIFAAQETGNTTQILAAMIAIAIMGFVIATTMRMIERKLCAWNVQKR